MYDKADPVDDANLDKSINELSRSIREQEELENRIVGLNGQTTNEDERTQMEQRKAFNEKKTGTS